MSNLDDPSNVLAVVSMRPRRATMKVVYADGRPSEEVDEERGGRLAKALEEREKLNNPLRAPRSP